MTYEQVLLKAQALTNDEDNKHAIFWLFQEFFNIDHTTYFMNLNEQLTNEKIAEFDGYIIITAEYNQAPSGVFKNALDFLKPQFADKVASFVGYGGVGGARAIEQLKLVFSEYQVATTQRQVNLMLMVDFINMSEFAPKDYQLDSLEELFVQTNKWAKALKTIR